MGKILKVLRFIYRYLIFFLIVFFASYGLFYPGFWKNVAGNLLGANVSMETLGLSFIVLIGIIYFTKTVQYFLTHTLKRFSVDSGVKDSFISLVGYFGYGLGIAIALSMAGIRMQNLAIVLGALSVGIGFGLQNIVNNFVSGIIILFERPIKVGDWIVVKGNEGVVKRIHMRATEIETFDKASVILPNSDILSNDFINWTHTNLMGRTIVKVGVSYDSDVLAVKEILLRCAGNHPLVLQTPQPVVLFREFGDNSLNFELRCIVKDVNQRLSVQSALMFAIFQEFKQAGVEIPFPQRVVHMETKVDASVLERLNNLEKKLVESEQNQLSQGDSSLK